MVFNVIMTLKFWQIIDFVYLTSFNADVLSKSAWSIFGLVFNVIKTLKFWHIFDVVFLTSLNVDFLLKSVWLIFGMVFNGKKNFEILIYFRRCIFNVEQHWFLVVWRHQPISTLFRRWYNVVCLLGEAWLSCSVKISKI